MDAVSKQRNVPNQNPQACLGLQSLQDITLAEFTDQLHFGREWYGLVEMCRCATTAFKIINTGMMVSRGKIRHQGILVQIVSVVAFPLLCCTFIESTRNIPLVPQAVGKTFHSSCWLKMDPRAGLIETTMPRRTYLCSTDPSLL